MSKVHASLFSGFGGADLAAGLYNNKKIKR